MDTLEITIQHRRGHHWPVVALHTRGSELPARGERLLAFGPNHETRLTALLLDARAAGQGPVPRQSARPLHRRPISGRQRRAAGPVGGGRPRPETTALGAPVRPGRTRRLGLPTTRHRVALPDLIPIGADPEQVRALVQRLADARLVVTTRDPDSGQTQVEVSHTALLSVIASDLDVLNGSFPGLKVISVKDITRE